MPDEIVCAGLVEADHGTFLASVARFPIFVDQLTHDDVDVALLYESEAVVVISVRPNQDHQPPRNHNLDHAAKPSADGQPAQFLRARLVYKLCFALAEFWVESFGPEDLLVDGEPELFEVGVGFGQKIHGNIVTAYGRFVGFADGGFKLVQGEVLHGAAGVDPFVPAFGAVELPYFCAFERLGVANF